jgi:hypothetical protein
MLVYLRVLYIQHDGRLTGAEVTIQADAVPGELVPLQRHDRVDFSSRCIVNGTSLVIFKDRKRHVVFDVTVRGYHRYWHGHNLSNKA